MRAVLRRPDFRLFFIGIVATIVGDSALLLVLAIWVKSLTGSSSLAGTTLFAVAAPALAAPLLGWAVDRFRRRPFLVVALLLTAVALVPLFLVHDRTRVWMIFVVAFLYGVSALMTGAATNGLIKELLPEELLAEANGAIQTVRQGLRLVAPIGGAGLFAAVGGGALAALDIACLLIGAGAIAALRVREAGPEPAQLNLYGEMTAGVRYLFGTASLRRIVIGLIIGITVLGFIETAVFSYVDEGLHHSPFFVSVIVCIQGIGGLTGGLVAAKVVRRFGELAASGIGIGAMGLGSAAFAYPSLLLGLAGAVVLGLGVPVAIVGSYTLIQRVTPSGLLGRVSAASDALIGTPQALSIAGGAALAAVLDYRLIFVLIAVGLFGSALYLWVGRRLSPPTTDQVVQSAMDIPTVPAEGVG
jgi:MFS family permease